MQSLRSLPEFFFRLTPAPGQQPPHRRRHRLTRAPPLTHNLRTDGRTHSARNNGGEKVGEEEEEVHNKFPPPSCYGQWPPGGRAEEE